MGCGVSPCNLRAKPILPDPLSFIRFDVIRKMVASRACLIGIAGLTWKESGWCGARCCLIRMSVLCIDTRCNFTYMWYYVWIGWLNLVYYAKVNRNLAFKPKHHIAWVTLWFMLCILDKHILSAFIVWLAGNCDGLLVVMMVGGWRVATMARRNFIIIGVVVCCCRAGRSTERTIAHAYSKCARVFLADFWMDVSRLSSVKRVV